MSSLSEYNDNFYIHNNRSDDYFLLSSENGDSNEQDINNPQLPEASRFAIVKVQGTRMTAFGSTWSKLFCFMIMVIRDSFIGEYLISYRFSIK